MTPISQYKFYDLGAKLHRVVSNKTAVGAAEMFVPLMEAQTALDALIKGDPFQLELSKAEANALLNKLAAIFDKNFIDVNTRQFRFPSREEIIDVHELALLRSLVEKFETVFSAELSRKAVFAVPKRGLFDAYELTENADHQFAEETLRVMPNSVRADVRAAGRALAFGLTTSCCFHLVRATEAMLSRYNEAFGGGTASKPDVLWRDALPRLIALSKNKHSHSPDPLVLSMLSDVDARIRPILQHTEDNVSVNDATMFFNTTCSLLSMMLDGLHMQHRLKTAQETLSDSDDDEEFPVTQSKSA